MTPVEETSARGELARVRHISDDGRRIYAEFRNAQVAIGSLEELITRSAPPDILWPTANEAIGWSQRAAMAARGKK